VLLDHLLPGRPSGHGLPAPGWLYLALIESISSRCFATNSPAVPASILYSEPIRTMRSAALASVRASASLRVRVSLRHAASSLGPPLIVRGGPPQCTSAPGTVQWRTRHAAGRTSGRYSAVERFAHSTSAEVRFRCMTYQALFESLLPALQNAEHAAHLRSRYFHEASRDS
jgi:hypothetical protein